MTRRFVDMKVYQLIELYGGLAGEDEEREVIETFSSSALAEQVIEGLTGKPAGQWPGGETWLGVVDVDRYEIEEVTVRS